jgi:hypothetical protein
VNHATVARVLDEAMQTLWPGGVKFDNVLLLSYRCSTVHEKKKQDFQ